MAERYCILYNPKSGNERGTARAQELCKLLEPAQIRLVTCQEVEDYAAFFASLAEDETFILAGGDGTLNRFVNNSDGKRGGKPVWYYPAGSGNDFWIDIGGKMNDRPRCIDRYLEHLPTVYVNGIQRKFLNGIGFGIDGYCCEEGDRRREQHPGKRINYTPIAVKGLAGGYHPANAMVTVDGVTEEYRKVWLSPTMMGRYFGGGMMATPGQDRLNGEHTVSCMTMNRAGKLLTLLLFPTIFKGWHVHFTRLVHVRRGHHVRVKFDCPTSMQIDGETVLNVTEYEVEYK